ncbi:MAG: cyclase family protein [Chloroflexi bacterium]|nr:cyclase family protein [Chloroflexota bacterium]
MNRSVPDEATVLGYSKALSNWGRWGKDDQLGTLNLVTPSKTLQAAKLVREGITVSCARPIIAESAPDALLPPLHFMIGSGEGFTPDAVPLPGQAQSSTDFIGMAFHGTTITHVDSLAHIFWEGRMYNGRPASLVTTRQGATASSIELLRHGVVTRGVLLDVARVRGVDWMEPGEAVFPQDLDAAEEACGARVQEGDVLLVRTGNYRRRLEKGPWDQGANRPGPHAECLPWFHQRGIAMLGSDTPNDVAPSGYQRMSLPVHQVGIVAMGLWLIDNCNLEDLARACAQQGRWEFLLSVSPLPIRYGTGSPANPVAIF